MKTGKRADKKLSYRCNVAKHYPPLVLPGGLVTSRVQLVVAHHILPLELLGHQTPLGHRGGGQIDLKVRSWKQTRQDKRCMTPADPMNIFMPCCMGPYNWCLLLLFSSFLVPLT